MAGTARPGLGHALLSERVIAKLHLLFCQLESFWAFGGWSTINSSLSSQLCLMNPEVPVVLQTTQGLWDGVAASIAGRCQLKN